jgi:hypothetical protein
MFPNASFSPSNVTSPSVRTTSNNRGRVANHAWEFSAVYLSGTTLADLGSNVTKWNLTRINSAGLGSLVFNGVTYPCGTFDGITQAWTSVTNMLNLAASPHIGEFLINKSNKALHFPLSQRSGGGTPYTQVGAGGTNLSYGIRLDDISASTSVTTSGSNGVSHLVQFGLGSDKKAFIVVDRTAVIASTAFPAFFTTNRIFYVGGWSNATPDFLGSLARISIHKAISGTAAELAAIAQTRYDDYIAGSVLDWKIWNGVT